MDREPFFSAEGVDFSAVVTGEKTVVGLQVSFTTKSARFVSVLHPFQLRGLAAFLDQLLDDVPGGRDGK